MSPAEWMAPWLLFEMGEMCRRLASERLDVSAFMQRGAAWLERGWWYDGGTGSGGGGGVGGGGSGDASWPLEIGPAR